MLSKMNRIKFEIGCFLRKRRLIRARNKAIRSSIRLKKAREERIWIENNPHIHILNYPYYKLMRLIRRKLG